MHSMSSAGEPKPPKGVRAASAVRQTVLMSWVAVCVK